jgi:hypothetical protein
MTEFDQCLTQGQSMLAFCLGPRDATILEPQLTLRHREGSRTLAAGWASASERPVTGDRIPLRCSRQRQRVATRRSRHHLVIKLARHIAVKISGEGERPALCLSRYKAGFVRRETEFADA